MMDGIDVSIVIAAYNAAPFLERCIASAQAQENVTLEIIIVDDASTDDTVAVIKRLAAGDNRIKYLQMPVNGGPAVARNAGLDAARGEWVAILDADDAFVPARMETMVRIGASMRADIVLGNIRYYDAANDTLLSAGLKEGDAPEPLDAAGFVAGARPYGDETDLGLTKPVFRRDFLDAKNVRYPVWSRHGEDFLMMMQALLEGAVCVLSRRADYLYTTRASGFSRTIVDYKGMVRHSQDLLKDPRVQGDARLVESLGQRIEALKRLSIERNYDLFKRERNYPAMVYHGLTDPSFRRFSMRKIRYQLRKAIKRGQ